MKMKSKTIKIILISLVILFFLPVVVLVGFFGKQTQFLILRTINQRKDMEVKIANYADFVKKHPNYIPPRLKLAGYYRFMSDSAAADEELEKVDGYLNSAFWQYNSILINIDPENKDALIGMIIIHGRKGEFDKIKPLYERLVEAYPENSFYRTRLASIYFEENDMDKALEEANLAIKHNPLNGRACLIAATIYDRENNKTKALEVYKSAAANFRKRGAVNPEVNVRYRMGQLYLERGLLFDAMQQLERITKIRPNAIGVYIDLAGVYGALGLYDKTISMLMSSPIDVDLWGLTPPSDEKLPRVQKIRIYIILAQAYLSKGDYANAIKYFKDAETLGVTFKPGFMDWLKDRDATPWKDLEEKYKAGDKVKGMVVDISGDGATIRLGDGVEGFIGTGDFSWIEEVVYPPSVLKEGEEVEAVILGVDEEDRKVAMGIKQLMPDPWEDIAIKARYGFVWEGKITNITSRKMHVELEPGVEGWLDVSALDAQADQPVDTLYKEGDIVRVKAVRVDAKKRNVQLIMEGLGAK